MAAKKLLLVSLPLMLASAPNWAANDAKGPPPAKVITEQVTERMVSKSTRMVGIIDFDRIADIASEISGIIDRHQLHEGRVVKRGEILVELNSDLLEQDIRITKTEIEQIEVELEKLQRNLDRLGSLIESEATSKRAYEEILYSHKAAAKRRLALEQRVERLEIQIAKSKIRAPFDGVILEKFKEIGEWTAPQSPVAKLAATNDVIARVAVAEDLLPYLKAGDRLHVTIPAIGENQSGDIRTVSAVANQRTKTLFLKISLKYRPQLLQNMTATVEVPTSNKQQLRILKRDAVVRFKGQEFVYTVTEEKAKLLPVNIVARLGEYIGVDNVHIKSGMVVVVDGNDRLKPDQAVAAEPAQP